MLDKQDLESILKDWDKKVKVSTIDGQFRIGRYTLHENYIWMVGQKGIFAIPYDKITIVQTVGLKY